LKAADELEKQNIHIRVVDCYSINPVDAATLKKCISETEQKILVTVEDHFEHGGFGDFATAALFDQKVQVIKMAVRKISQSGTKDELLKDAGIDASHIVARVKSLLKQPVKQSYHLHDV
jgi:transketolase